MTLIVVCVCSRLAAAEQAHRAREQVEKSAELLQQQPTASKLRAASAPATSSMAAGGSSGKRGGSVGDQRAAGGGGGPSSLFIFSETNRIRRFTKFLIECGHTMSESVTMGPCQF